MKVRVALAGQGHLPTERCGVSGCPDPVLFWCQSSREWVCFPHGYLVLKEEWGLLGRGNLEVHGEVKVAVPQVKSRRTDAEV